VSIEEMTALLGWCTVINLVLLVVSTLVLFLFQKIVLRFHEWFSGLSAEQLKPIYVQYLAQMKLLWIIFNLTPYLAIRVFILGD
jgi:hypothetical protein